MNRFFRWAAAAALAAALAPAVADERLATADTVQLRFAPRFILETVAERMQVALRPDVPLPRIFVESAVALRQFQDAMEPQWAFRPPVVSNAYSIATNEIYLTDDASFYRRFRRTLDDSLAHELVHYLQARYLREDLTTESTEVQAAEIQRWFRDTHAQPTRDLASAGELTPACAVSAGAGGVRTVRCASGARRTGG